MRKATKKLTRLQREKLSRNRMALPGLSAGEVSPLMNVNQAAQFLNIGLSTLYADKCAIPYIKIGGRRLYRRDVLERIAVEGAAHTGGAQ